MTLWITDHYKRNIKSSHIDSFIEKSQILWACRLYWLWFLHIQTHKWEQWFMQNKQPLESLRTHSDSKNSNMGIFTRHFWWCIENFFSTLLFLSWCFYVPLQHVSNFCLLSPGICVFFPVYLFFVSLCSFFLSSLSPHPPAAGSREFLLPTLSKCLQTGNGCCGSVSYCRGLPTVTIP